MSNAPILLPNGDSIAATLDLQGHFVQETSDQALLAAIQHLTSRTDLVTTAVNSVTEKLTADPVTGADMDAVVAAINAATDKLSDDPATGQQVTELADVIADILAKLPDDPATEGDLADVVSAVNAVTAKIPSGAATDAHVDLATAAINAVAAKLPTDAATGTAIAAVTAAVNAVTAKLPAAPALDSTLQQIRDRLPSLLENGRLAVKQSTPDRVVGPTTLNAANQTVVVSLEDGDVEVFVDAVSTTVPTTLNITAEAIMPDGRVLSVLGYQTSTVAGTVANIGTMSFNAANNVTVNGRYPLPPGATAFRIRCSSYTNGSVAVSLYASKIYRPTPGRVTTDGVVSLGTNTAASDSAGSTALHASAAQMLFNATAFDRERSNTLQQLLSSASRGSSATTADTRTYNARALRMILNVTAGTGFSLVPAIQGKGSTSAPYFQLLPNSTPAVTALGCYVYEVGLGVGPGADAYASRPIPYIMRATVSHNTSVTYSVDLELLV